MALGFATALRNACMDAIATYAGTSCKLRIYNGTQPATGGAATTLLAELTCNATAFAGAASSGVLTLNAITSDSSADASGTATWFRITKSDGTTHVMDGTVSTSGADLNFDTVTFVAGAVVAVSSFTITDGNP